MLKEKGNRGEIRL